MGKNSTQKTIEKMETMLSTGEWRAGQELPKARAICAEWNISASTLCTALQTVYEHKWIHKQGKKWIGGPEQMNGDITGNAKIRVAVLTILIFQHRLEEWGDFYSDLLAGFVHSFGMEANRHRVRLFPVLSGEEKPMDSLFPTGKRAIGKCIQSLGSGYLGTLVTPMALTTRNMQDWLVYFTKFDKPVIWMQNETGASLHPRLKNKAYFLQYGDWSRGVFIAEQLVLDALLQKGHTNVAYVCLQKHYKPWMKTRYDRLLDCARDDIQILNYSKCKEKTWYHAIAQVVKSGATAIISPNDIYAKELLFALHKNGIKVPQSISLVSFDNSYHLRPIPVTTVDFGVEELGYKCFHWFYGLLPVKRPEQLRGRCFLVDQGSIGCCIPPKA
jgi:hypothetical protein